jgi:uncharacterized protein YozE (UPF0346 family)
MLNNNEIPWTFKTWISEFKDVDLPIGDLARDISRDSDFPDEDSFGIIHKHLINKNADTIVLETFSTVWNFYLSSR